MDKKNLCDLDVAGQKVLVRVDYNVPMDETGKITDDTRIRASLETIKYLLEHKAAVILMAHLGRPKGQVNIKYSLAPVAKHLAKLLNMPVAFAGDCIGEEAEKAVQKLKPGKILMLENLHPEELYVLLCNIRNVFAGGDKENICCRTKRLLHSYSIAATVSAMRTSEHRAILLRLLPIFWLFWRKTPI